MKKYTLNSFWTCLMFTSGGPEIEFNWQFDKHCAEFSSTETVRREIWFCKILQQFYTS